MMIGPKTYLKQIKDKSYEELLEEKKKLIKEIEEFENNNDKELKLLTKPSPDVRYQCNLQYLAELCNLIPEKFRESRMNNKFNKNSSDDVLNDNIELKRIIKETIGNDDPYWNKQIFEIMTKVINLSEETESTIAQLINYNSNENNVSLSMQERIYEMIMEICKKININIERINNEELSGLAYYYKFKKVAKN